MLIANPLYDVVFRYLLADSRVAKLLISTIIGGELDELVLKPQEHSTDLEDRSHTVTRLDFAATVRTAEGAKTVLKEIQKAKFPSDIMRFRRYLGEQNRENVDKTGRGAETVPTPLVTIYFLGYPLDRIKAPIVKVNRTISDLTSGEDFHETERFIERPTHPSYIIQIPYLGKRRSSDLEILLSVFDQEKRTNDHHILNVRDEEFPENYCDLIRRLQSAGTDYETRQRMTLEDEVLADFQALHRELEEARERIREVDEYLAALSEKEAALAEKDALIEELEKKLREMKKSV